MHAVIDDHYPSIESILHTLNHYIGEPIVQEFVESNEDLVNLAKEELLTTSESFAAPAAESIDAFNNIFSKREVVDAYRALKAKSMTEIEGALSEALNSLCGDEFILEVQSFVKGGGPFDTNVELKATVKAKNYFR